MADDDHHQLRDGDGPRPPSGTAALTEGMVHANGLEFSFLECGAGPLALCLHGFPDTARTWRHLLPRLAGAGFRAVAPFMRGYAPTEVPVDGLYQSGALSADACALHESLGGDERAVLIGHDWGAIGAYGAASLEPERWRRLVTSAVPPMPAMMAAMTGYDQLRMSWYIFFFQNPLAELVVGLDDMSFVDRLWQDWSPGFDHSTETPQVKDALRRPENLAAALGYYRAMLDPSTHDPGLAAAQEAASRPPPMPTLYIHGELDGCVGAGVTEMVPAFLPAPGSRVEVVPGAGHFSHLESPEVVGTVITDFLTAP